MAIHAVRRPGFGDVVAVLGVGVIGTAIVELCRNAGVRRILVVDPDGSRHAVPLALGAHKAYARVEELVEEFGGTELGPSLVFDVTNAQESFGEAVEACEPGGKVIVITIPPHDHAELKASTARRKELDIQFSRRSRHTLGRLSAHRRGQVHRAGRRRSSPLMGGCRYQCSSPAAWSARTIVRWGLARAQVRITRSAPLKLRRWAASRRSRLSPSRSIDPVLDQAARTLDGWPSLSIASLWPCLVHRRSVACRAQVRASAP